MNGIKNHMQQLLSAEWNGKKVWECIRDGELTSAPAFKGKIYDSMPLKIMYVGHAVNGWEELDASRCSSLDEVADTILEQNGPDALDTFVNAEGSPYTTGSGNPRIYKHIESKFIRLIKQVLEFQNESDYPTELKTWYNDTKCWNQKFIWSNLYNIAPKKGGNPEDKFIKAGMTQYTEMIKTQIETYKPDIVIVCPLQGYFVPWKKERSFADILDSYEICNDGSTIIGKGNLGKTKVVVCKRPDARGTSYEDVQKMAKELSDYINCVCKQN